VKEILISILDRLNMFLPISAGLVEPTPFKRLQMHKSNPNSSDDVGAFHSQLIIEIDGLYLFFFV
jgi:hypothetical protein